MNKCSRGIGIKQLLLKHKHSKCVFLGQKDKCKIQEEHGYGFKPKLCRQFPFDKNNAIKLICGKVAEPLNNWGKPFIDNDAIFEYNGRIFSSEVLLYSIGKINPEDCVNSWYSILTYLGNSKDAVISKAGVDEAAKKTWKLPELYKFRLRTWLSVNTPYFLPERILLSLRKSGISIKFPSETFRLNFKDIESVKTRNSENKKLITILKKGHGLLYHPNYPEHLLFCLFFLDDISKQIAHNSNKETVDPADKINAFILLNGIMRFPRC